MGQGSPLLAGHLDEIRELRRHAGVVDLGGSITLEGTDENWTISGMNSDGGIMVGKRSGRGSGATTLVFPGTFTSGIGGQWLHCTTGGNSYGISYKTLIIDEPLVTDNPFPSWATSGQSDLTHLIVRMPKVTSFGGNPGFWDVISLSATKFDWWDLSSVASIHPHAFCYAWDSDTYRLKSSGKLSLPSYCDVTNSLPYLTNVREISLGGLTRRTTVKKLYKSLYGNWNLKKVTIHNDRNMAVPQPGVFSTSGIPSEIVLTGAPIQTDVFANLLNVVTAAATKPVKVYVSSAYGWSAGLDYLDEPTDAERDEAPGETVLGVYRGGAAAPNDDSLKRAAI